MNAPPAAPPSGKPSVEDLLSTLMVSVDKGFSEMKTDIEMVVNDVKGLHGRITSVESRQGKLEMWRQSSSDRARALLSSTTDGDLANEARLADEIVARQALAAKVDVLGTKQDALDAKQDAQLAILGRIDTFVKRFAASPYVIQIAKLAGAAIIGWFASKGLR